LNELRRSEPALQRFENLRHLETHSDDLFGFAKGNDLFVVVNLDPASPREGLAIVPPQLGLPPEFTVRDLLTGDRYRWRIGRNYVGLRPGGAHVLKAELGA
jgi:starch synthase (maltosyl-transferring)